MKHLGDITKIIGAEVPPVNVIIGGSPCQDLSVAGKRAGLAGERSGLFMEQLRVIKEMRKADEHRGRTGSNIRPRFMVWENVPGAFSSNRGADFGAVLQETIRVVCKEAPVIPMPNDGWPTSGCLVGMGGDWSVAWRVLDAQFWGVPQRRRRIALVADFGGLTAPEILFEREGVSGYYPQGRTPWERATRTVKSRSGTAGTRVAPTYCLQGNGIDRADTAGCNGRGWTEGVSYTLNTVDRPAVYDARGNGDSKIAPTMTGDHQNRVTDYTAVVVTHCAWDGSQVSPTLTANNAGGNQRMPDKGNFNGVLALDRAALNQGENAQYNFKISDEGINSTLVSKGPSAVCAFHGQASESADISVSESNESQVDVLDKMLVRRLTPLECERLQGFPDGWTDIGEYTDSKGKKRNTTDSNRYKALGNSIAIPPWFYVLAKLTLFCGSDSTMASLFDGIGGFPLIWEMLNGKGSCLWASEIDEFPIAVTKARFSQEEAL